MRDNSDPNQKDDNYSHSLVSYNKLGMVCSGDSGGPAFTSLARGQYVLLGYIIN